MSDLAWCPLPLIAHMDGRTPEEGAFLLVLSLADDKVIFLNGPTVTIHILSRENFRRVWSGFALLPSGTNPRKDALLCGLGFAAGLFALRLWRSVRRPAPSASPVSL